eukprot:m.66903 g.66903  ORF g.66903 m.66903 type:complete len:58 (+) comp13613_c2_seq2:317-490(+)
MVFVVYSLLSVLLQWIRTAEMYMHTSSSSSSFAVNTAGLKGSALPFFPRLIVPSLLL